MILIILFQFILWDSSYINRVEKNIIIHLIKRKTTILQKHILHKVYWIWFYRRLKFNTYELIFCFPYITYYWELIDAIITFSFILLSMIMFNQLLSLLFLTVRNCYKIANSSVGVDISLTKWNYADCKKQQYRQQAWLTTLSSLRQ